MKTNMKELWLTPDILHNAPKIANSPGSLGHPSSYPNGIAIANSGYN